MGIGKKILNLGNLATSSLKEKAKCTYLEKKLEEVEKKLKESSKFESAHLLIEKENLEKKIKEEKERECLKRENLKEDLKENANKSKVIRKKETENLNTVEKIRKEMKDFPITTIADDLAEGIAQLGKAEDKVKKNPKNINAWLNLAETLKLYKKAFVSINALKAPVDPIGTTIDLTTEFVGGAVENAVDKEKYTYERCLAMAKHLGATDKDIEKFKNNFKINMISSVVKGTGHMVCKQGKKIIKTSERAIDFAVEKFIK